MIIRITILSSILFLIVSYFDLTVMTHDAIPTGAMPLGWSYPTNCCSGNDCRQVGSVTRPAKIMVAETDRGYRISSTGEIIGYGDKRIKDSPDGEYHWCSVSGADDGRTICLFTPPRGY